MILLRDTALQIERKEFFCFAMFLNTTRFLITPRKTKINFSMTVQSRYRMFHAETFEFDYEIYWEFCG